MGRAFLFLYFSITAIAAPPAYTTSSVTNSASGIAGPLTRYGLFTIYGDELASVTQSAGNLTQTVPSTLGLSSVRVYLDGSNAGLLYISPHQVNFLVPMNLTPGMHSLTVARDGLAGPTLRIELRAAAPAFFLAGDNTAAATDAKGRLLTASGPAQPGDVVVIYGTGFGEVNGTLGPLAVASKAMPLKDMSRVAVLINGQAAGQVLYAGVTPGFAGLYQLNWRVPEDCPPNPEIRIVIGDEISPAGVVLPVGARPTADNSPNADRQNATTP